MVGLFAFTGLAGAKEISVAVIMYGPAHEGTWDPAAYEALMKVQKTVPFTLHLNENTAVQDAEKAMRDWAARGVDVVWAHSDIYTDQLLKVAPRFKKVHFVAEITLDPRTYEGYAQYAPDKTSENVLFNGDTPYEAHYLAGYASALMSKSQKIAMLQPFESPNINRFINSFLFGAQAAKPNIDAKLVIIGDFVAPAETRDAVKTLAQQGVDAIFVMLDDNSGILESAAQGINCVAPYRDKHEIAPDTVITSTCYGAHVMLKGVFEAVAKGTFAEYRAKHYFRPMSLKEDSLSLGKWGTHVPDSVKGAVAKVEAKLRSGEITWYGDRGIDAASQMIIK
jgi:basic membrane protein A